MTTFACDICTNEYDFNNFRPVVGSCGHSICLGCSRRIAGVCPKCRDRSFNNPRTNFGMLELIENRRIEKERADQEQRDLLRAVQETFDEVDQEKMLQKMSLEGRRNGEGQESSREGNGEEIPRDVVLNAEYTKSGIDINGYDRGGPIFVCSIKEGSPAEGFLRVGDQILSVNGISLLEKTVYEAEEILRKAGNPFKLRLQYKPQEWPQILNQFENFLLELLNEKKNPVRGELFVRALDVGQINLNNALKFWFGDILEITHKPHKDFWIARKVLPDGSKSEKGAIWSSNFLKEVRTKENTSNGVEEPAFPYLVVKRHFGESVRLIAVLGALKEKFIESLMEKRPNLIGRIVSLPPNAIQALHQANVFPIVIFIGPRITDRIIDWSNGTMSEEEAEKELKEVRKLAKDMPLFTKRFYGWESFEETVRMALEHIDQESRPDYWIPIEDQSGLL